MNKFSFLKLTAISVSAWAAGTPKAVGYVEKSALDGRVKALLSIE